MKSTDLDNYKRQQLPEPWQWEIFRKRLRRFATLVASIANFILADASPRPATGRSKVRSAGRVVKCAAMTQVMLRTVNQAVEEGSVHSLETRDGLLLLCVSSLSDEWKQGVKL
jgi:hypothetical protein